MVEPPFAAHFAELTPEQRQRSLEATLAAGPVKGDVWIFGYGGLMWDDIAQADERRHAQLSGWHRSLCVWSALARGRPDRPGICLGLDRGGACEGVALRVTPPDVESRLRIVWEREMWTDVYRPEWVHCDTQAGAVTAIAFVVNRDSKQFSGPLPKAAIAEYIAIACGEKGNCRDYLAQVLEDLEAMNVSEPELEEMLARVDALAPSS